jgi:hypothetical protein
VAEKKATNPKAEAIFSYMQECDLIIIDDVVNDKMKMYN